MDNQKGDVRRMESEVSKQLQQFYQSQPEDDGKLRNIEVAKHPEPDKEYSQAFNQDLRELEEDLYRVMEQNSHTHKLSDAVAPYEFDDQ